MFVVRSPLLFCSSANRHFFHFSLFSLCSKDAHPQSLSDLILFHTTPLSHSRFRSNYFLIKVWTPHFRECYDAICKRMKFHLLRLATSHNVKYTPFRFALSFHGNVHFSIDNTTPFCSFSSCLFRLILSIYQSIIGHLPYLLNFCSISSIVLTGNVRVL